MYGTADFLQKVTSTPDEVRRHTIVKDSITQRLGDNVKTIVQSHTRRDEPLQSTDMTNKLVVDLETVFLHGLKEKWLNQKFYHKDPYEMPQLSFWHFLMVYSHKSVISQINLFNQIVTDVGRCRAWVRLALNQGTISSYLSTIASDQKQLKKSYLHYAYLRDTERMDILRKILDGLECFSFDLATNSSLLNEWIDTPIMMAGAWTPPVLPERGLEPVECAIEVLEDSNEHSERVDSIEASDEPVLYSATSTPLSKRSEFKSQSTLCSATDSPISKSEAKNESPVMATKLNMLPKPVSLQQQQITRQLLEEALFSTTPSNSNNRISEASKTDGKSDVSITSNFSSINSATNNSRTFDASKTGIKADVSVSGAIDSKTSNRISETSKTNVKSEVLVPSDIGSIESATTNNENRASDALKLGVNTDSSASNQTDSIKPTRKSPPPMLEKELPVKKDGAVVEDAGKTKTSDSPVPEEASVAETTKTRNSPPTKETAAEPHSLVGRGWSLSEDDDPEHVAPKTCAPIQISRQSSVDDSYAAVLQKYESRGLSIMGTPDFSFMSQVEQLKEDQPSTKAPAEIDENDSEEYTFVSDPKTGYPKSFSFTHHMKCIPRELGMLSQNFTCNSCPRNIGLMFGKERFCMYSGRYFCQECHGDEVSEIPARMVYNWDFRKYPVCKEAKKFLGEKIEDPVFNIMELNPKMLEVLPQLLRVKDARTRLHYLRGYLFTCRDSTANELRKLIYPAEYLYEHINLYALKDFLSIRNGELLNRLLSVEKFARAHVLACELCKAKGFICEICSEEPVIYPFETDSTYRCSNCGAVYHYNCWEENSCCTKCKRLGRRQQERVTQWLESGHST